MRREVEAGLRLGRHPNVMPVLDHDEEYSWFVMPRAQMSLDDYASEVRRDPNHLTGIVSDLCSGLKAAHDIGWIHRDVKPSNILRLGERWVLSDWGLVRRQPGATTHPGRTQLGTSYGTAGFAAPELSEDAHSASPTADIYSIGQIVGTLLTGRVPVANVPLLPQSGPWRTIVRQSTLANPAHRPASVDALLQLVSDELREPPLDVLATAERMLERYEGGDTAAGRDLLRLIAANPDDYDLYIDVLPRVPSHELTELAEHLPVTALDLVQAMRGHKGGDWGRRSYKWADSVLGWMVSMVEIADTLSDFDLLGESLDAYLAWEDDWNQFRPQDRMAMWLTRVSGEAARVAASPLRRHPHTSSHLRAQVTDRKVDRRILASLAG